FSSRRPTALCACPWSGRRFLLSGTGFRLSAQDHRNHRFRLAQQQALSLDVVLVTPFDAGRVRPSGSEAVCRHKTPNAERDGGIGGNVVLGKEAETVGIRKLPWREFGEDCIAIEQYDTRLVVLLGFELWITRRIERFDQGDLLYGHMLAPDSDNVFHRN